MIVFAVYIRPSYRRGRPGKKVYQKRTRINPPSDQLGL
jgi:hypothetical protein